MSTVDKYSIIIANYLEDKMSPDEEEAFIRELESNEEMRHQYEDELMVSALLQTDEYDEKQQSDAISHGLLLQPADEHVKIIETALEKKVPEKKSGLVIRMLRDYKTIAAASLLVILFSVFFLFQKKKSNGFVATDTKSIVKDSVKKADSMMLVNRRSTEQITKATTSKDSIAKNNSTVKINNTKSNIITNDSEYKREMVEKNSLKDSISKSNYITKIQIPSSLIPINKNDVIINNSTEKGQQLNSSSNNIATKNIFKEFYTAYSSQNDPVEINEYYQSLIKGAYPKVLSATSADYQLMGADTRSKVLDQYMQLYKGLAYLGENKPNDAIKKFDSVLQFSSKTAPQYYDAQWYYMLALLKKEDWINANNVASLIVSSASLYRSKAAQVNYTFLPKDEKVTMEQVKQQCSNLPTEKRARLSVTRFSVTTSTPQTSSTTSPAPNNRLSLLRGLGGGNNNNQSGAIPPTLGENLTTMLTNALQGVTCYRVLESLNNNTDLTKEIDAGNNGYSSSKKAPKAGKQLGAQIVVTGEVIEYSVHSKGVKVIGVGSNKQTIKMGFNLKMINPETRDVIVSRVFRVQSRANKSVSVLGLVNTGNADPAVAAVMEDGVVEAVEYLAKMRDSLNITAAGNFVGNGNSDGSIETEIDLSNISHDAYSSFADMLKTVTGYKSMDKSFSGGTGSFTVTHTGSDDDFQEAVIKKAGSKYTVTGENSGKLELKGK